MVAAVWVVWVVWVVWECKVYNQPKSRKKNCDKDNQTKKMKKIRKISILRNLVWLYYYLHTYIHTLTDRANWTVLEVFKFLFFPYNFFPNYFFEFLKTDMRSP